MFGKDQLENVVLALDKISPRPKRLMTDAERLFIEQSQKARIKGTALDLTPFDIIE